MATKTTAANAAIASLIIGDGVFNALNHANCYVGFGTSNQAESASDTDLIGTKVRVINDSVARTTATITIVVTVPAGTATFTHAELAVFNASSGVTMFIRDIIAAFGVKAALDVWVVTITMPVS